MKSAASTTTIATTATAAAAAAVAAVAAAAFNFSLTGEFLKLLNFWEFVEQDFFTFRLPLLF